MPIRKSEQQRYPKDWAQISARIRKRAQDCCEDCGVMNKVLGGRMANGYFLPAFPLSLRDEHGEGYGARWPQPGEMAMCGNSAIQVRLRIIQIVLTVAHLDHQPENNADGNLKALCQRCHLRYDAKEKARGIKSRRRAQCAISEMFP